MSRTTTEQRLNVLEKGKLRKILVRRWDVLRQTGKNRTSKSLIICTVQ